MNLLQHETSPYLLQHANNPVHWMPWGDEAIAKAKHENKPILVSIGYAACHWCHVMEHESFEDEKVAALMNQYFVNIKVDREERPDVDHTYMDALQAMNGSGGWPLNVFLTPDLKPFYGGTYFPPTKAHNRASWTDVITAIYQAWMQRSNELIAQAEELTAHLQKTNAFGTAENKETINTIENLILVKNNLLKNADTIDGGFGAAPKFPQFHSITYLLRHFHFFNDKAALQQAELSLQKMIKGGIYDQLGGGLARYSTDTKWLVPHFEKMLYDNALFLNALSDAYQITKNNLYKKTIDHTVQFLQNELMHSNGLFYAAIDADSEGVEGKFYCFTKIEIDALLTPLQAKIIASYYDVTNEGNFTEPHHNITTNILHVVRNTITIANELVITDKEVNEELAKAKSILLTHRNKRVRPQTDDKCILAWNALMNKALVCAYLATQNKHYLQLAQNNMQQLLSIFITYNNEKEIVTIKHTFKNNNATVDAFLDDVAYLGEALFYLYNATLNENYLQQAILCVNYIDKFFIDVETPFYFYTNSTQLHTIVRKKEVYDGATPSANGVFAHLLFDLGTLTDNQNWKNIAFQMLNNLLNPVTKHTGSFAVWATLLQKIAIGINEISISKIDDLNLINKNYIPYKVLKTMDLQNFSQHFMLCKNQKCNPIVQNFDLVLHQIKEEEDLICIK